MISETLTAAFKSRLGGVSFVTEPIQSPSGWWKYDVIFEHRAGGVAVDCNFRPGIDPRLCAKDFAKAIVSGPPWAKHTRISYMFPSARRQGG